MKGIDSIYEIPPEENDEIYEIKDKPKRLTRYTRVVVGVFIVMGLVYISGIYQALLYQRTPLGTPQVQTESLLSAETIVVPVRIFVFRNNESFGSERTVADIRQIVRNASLIWEQADIDIETDKIVFIDASDIEIGNFLGNPGLYAQSLDEYDPGVINVFLMKSLKGVQGVNGVAFSGVRAVAIADFTTVYDFRVLAHEIGHVLGLGHTEKDKGQLMYTGANGFEISPEEVLNARKTASGF